MVPHNVGLMRQKQAGEPHLQDIFVGDICDIRGYEEGYFDVVLCMGAFYHLDGAAFSDM
ncbi:methyltransferase domain-containing protein [Lachnotalea sp. AF33-28]|uniref:methyltransferase domain-containing protein n=1 Tax=Lachnotalea sp. AF33-28 TaxID=2292046 RepID=UPI003FA5C38F